MATSLAHVCVLLGGPDRTIVVGGKEYSFEDHPRLGPCPFWPRKVGGGGRERDLSAGHAFWTAVQRWCEEGKQIGPDGRCVWTPAPHWSEGAVHLGGKDWMLKGSFDPSKMTACPGCKHCAGRTGDGL